MHVMQYMDHRTSTFHPAQKFSSAVQLNASEPFLFSETFARILPTDCQSSGPIWFPSSGRLV